MDVSREVLNCAHVTLFWVDRVASVLIAANPKAADEGIVIPLDRGIVGLVAGTQHLANVTDAYADARFDSNTDKDTGFTTRTILCAPVVDEERTTVAAAARSDSPADARPPDALPRRSPSSKR